jgi:hypothetical protein
MAQTTKKKTSKKKISSKKTAKKKTLKKKPTTKAKSVAAFESFAAAPAAALKDGRLKDGRLEVATALAMTSDLVTVDARQDPFTTKPPDLFPLTFNSDLVGITTADLVRTFFANLKALLPEIASDIDRIPENPSAVIRDVARFVRLALVGVTP